MRASTTVLAIVALGATGCATTGGRTCKPLASWSAPAYACTTPVPAQVPEPPPEPPPSRVQVKDEMIEISDKVQFETGSAVLLKDSEKLLDEVAKAMTDHPEIQQVEVGGHTDARGNDGFNLDLSDKRAASVRDYLVGKGIAAERLSAKGYGETKPIADNETEDGQYANRRVEFKILRRE
jgi:OOP family OmpA-OmpF porin